MKGIFTFLAAAICAVSLSKNPVSGSNPPLPLSGSEELFETTRIWDVELHFTAENWERIQPEWKGGFGPGGFFAPAFMDMGDKNRDGLLSEEEFLSLGQLIFCEWTVEDFEHLEKEDIIQGMADFGSSASDGKLVLSGIEGERNGIASVLGVSFPDSHADLVFEGTVLENVSARHKGNGTFMEARGSQKYSFKLDLNDDYPGRELAGVKKLNLHNCITDDSYMNEVLSYRLFRDAGVEAPRTAYARLNLKTPGAEGLQYHGLYTLVENVDKEFVKSHFGTKGGVILKPVTPSLFTYLGDDWQAYKQIYDPKSSISESEEARFIELCKLVSNADKLQFEQEIGEYIDLDNLARFLAVSVLLSDLDGILGPGQNLYLYLHPETGKFIFVPWDQDHSFGQMKRTQEHREKLSIRRPWDAGNDFLERMFDSESFYALYTSYVASFSKELFTPERLSAQVDELAALLDEPVKQESEEKYGNFRKLVEWDPAGDTIVVPEALASHNPGPFGSTAGIKPVKGFVVKRSLSVEDQLAGRSEGIEDTFPIDIGTFFARMDYSRIFMDSMDVNKDNQLSFDEIEQGFADWFSEWNETRENNLSAIELKTGINSSLSR